MPSSASPSTPRESTSGPTPTASFRSSPTSSPTPSSSPRPGTEIHLRARRSDVDEAEIQVRDQGRGIPEDKLDSIFERFHQVDASDSRAMGGTGLGLSICRSIVTQHGGRIWATSTLGKGSTFHFTLPTRPASNLL